MMLSEPFMNYISEHSVSRTNGAVCMTELLYHMTDCQMVYSGISEISTQNSS